MQEEGLGTKAAEEVGEKEVVVVVEVVATVGVGAEGRPSMPARWGNGLRRYVIACPHGVYLCLIHCAYAYVDALPS